MSKYHRFCGTFPRQTFCAWKTCLVIEPGHRHDRQAKPFRPSKPGMRRTRWLLYDWSSIKNGKIIAQYDRVLPSCSSEVFLYKASLQQQAQAQLYFLIFADLVFANLTTPKLHHAWQSYKSSQQWLPPTTPNRISLWPVLPVTAGLQNMKLRPHATVARCNWYL